NSSPNSMTSSTVMPSSTTICSELRPRLRQMRYSFSSSDPEAAHGRSWKPAAVVIVLVMADWIAYTRRGPASPGSTSALPRSNAIEQQAPFAPAKPAANSTSKPQTARVATQGKKKVPKTTSQRRRVWRDVDYIAEDVTVRYVTLKPAPQKRPVGSTVQPAAQRIQ